MAVWEKEPKREAAAKEILNKKEKKEKNPKIHKASLLYGFTCCKTMQLAKRSSSLEDVYGVMVRVQGHATSTSCDSCAENVGRRLKPPFSDPSGSFR